MRSPFWLNCWLSAFGLVAAFACAAMGRGLAWSLADGKTAARMLDEGHSWAVISKALGRPVESVETLAKRLRKGKEVRGYTGRAATLNTEHQVVIDEELKDKPWTSVAEMQKLLKCKVAGPCPSWSALRLAMRNKSHPCRKWRGQVTILRWLRTQVAADRGEAADTGEAMDTGEAVDTGEAADTDVDSLYGDSAEDYGLWVPLSRLS